MKVVDRLAKQLKRERPGYSKLQINEDALAAVLAARDVRTDMQRKRDAGASKRRVARHLRPYGCSVLYASQLVSVVVAVKFESGTYDFFSMDWMGLA